MRNFWIEGTMSGRKTTLRGGPRGKNGTFLLDIYAKENGVSVHAVEVKGEPTPDGKLAVAMKWSWLQNPDSNLKLVKSRAVIGDREYTTLIPSSMTLFFGGTG